MLLGLSYLELLTNVIDEGRIHFNCHYLLNGWLYDGIAQEVSDFLFNLVCNRIIAAFRNSLERESLNDVQNIRAFCTLIRSENKQEIV